MSPPLCKHLDKAAFEKPIQADGTHGFQTSSLQMITAFAPLLSLIDQLESLEQGKEKNYRQG